MEKKKINWILGEANSKDGSSSSLSGRILIQRFDFVGGDK